MFVAVEPYQQGEKILVEVFSLVRDHSPVEELVTAVANSRRWKGRLSLKVHRLASWAEATTPYGTIVGNTVVVSGTHVISKPNYWTLTQALEECEG